jgi:surface carbohydrate biosynthesis protein
MPRTASPQPVDLLLFVEHAARELDVAAAVTARLRTDHGLRVQVAPTFHQLQRTLARYEPRAVAVPYFMGCSDHAIDRIVTRWPHASYLNLAYEQVYNRFTASYKCPRDAVSQSHVLHHAWGEGYRRYLQGHGVPADHVAVNGNPVFALYREPYVHALPSRDDLAARHGLDAGRRWVLVPENYSFAFVSRAAALRRWGRKEPAQALGSRQFAAESLAATAAWWKRAAAEHSEIELIVRPRPAIDSRLFLRRLREMIGTLPPNLHVIKDGAVREWIVASDVVFSSFSTTLIEAAVARRPIYAMQPVPMPDYFRLDFLDRVQTVTTADAFCAAAAGPDAPNNWANLETWAIGACVGNGDAIAGLADLLADVCRNSRPTRIAPPGVLGRDALLALSSLNRLASFRGRWRERSRRWMKTAQIRLGLKGDPYEKDRFTEKDVSDRVWQFTRLMAEQPVSRRRAG